MASMRETFEHYQEMMNRFPDEDRQAIEHWDNVVKACGKEIREKPVKNQCPYCRQVMLVKSNFCPDCGQALDWEG